MGSVSDKPPSEPAPNDRTKIENVSANYRKGLCFGIVVLLVYFSLLTAWFNAERKQWEMAEIISFALGISFFPVIGVGMYLMLAGLVDWLILVHYRRHPESCHNHSTKHQIWLFNPPSGNVSWRVQAEGTQGQVVNQPLRLLHANSEWLYIERKIAKAHSRVRRCLQGSAGYLACLALWQLDVMAPIRAEEAAYSTFLLLAFFVPFIISVLFFEGVSKLRRFSRYQRKHLELLQQYNRIQSRIDTV